MAEFFNLDNPIWRFMGKVFDMMVLTVLWVVTSLPVLDVYKRQVVKTVEKYKEAFELLTGSKFSR